MLSSWFMSPSRTSAVHPSNAWLPIFVNPSGSSISCKFVQPRKGVIADFRHADRESSRAQGSCRPQRRSPQSASPSPESCMSPDSRRCCPSASSASAGTIRQPPARSPVSARVNSFLASVIVSSYLCISIIQHLCHLSIIFHTFCALLPRFFLPEALAQIPRVMYNKAEA